VGRPFLAAAGFQAAFAAATVALIIELQHRSLENGSFTVVSAAQPSKMVDGPTAPQIIRVVTTGFGAIAWHCRN
jgi:hypothetical protein